MGRYNIHPAQGGGHYHEEKKIQRPSPYIGTTKRAKEN